MSRFIYALKNKNGFSLVLVLCVMLLLLTISTSVLVAASSSMSSSVDQSTYHQLNLTADSMIKTIGFSLQTETLPKAANLGNKLLEDVYSAFSQALPYPNLYTIALDPPLPDTALSSLALSFPKVEIHYEPAEPEIPADPDAGTEVIPRRDAFATVALTMEVKFTVTVKDKATTTLLTYELTGARMQDNGVNLEQKDLPIFTRGDWRLVNIAKTNS